jgi:hypothetical protein
VIKHLIDSYEQNGGVTLNSVDEAIAADLLARQQAENFIEQLSRREVSIN